MTAWGLARSVGLAVLVSPLLLGIFGLALKLARGEQSLADTGKVLLGMPVIWAFALVLGGIPVLLGTGIAAGILTPMARLSGLPTVLYGLAGLIAFATTPIFLGRYPNGDGGTMQSLVEQFKAMLACSIGAWCALSLWQARTAG